jgi:hypothetical protein
LKRRETDIEGDLPAAAAASSVELNTPELPATVESDTESDDGAETEEVSDDDADDEGGDEEVSEAEAEAEAEAETIEHVEDTNTNGIYLTFHHQKGTGQLAMRLEAPVWMLGMLFAVVTAYMWMVVFMIKR